MSIITFKTKLREYFLRLSGRSLKLKNDIKLEHVWFGNNYGGFYLYPKFLNTKSIVYSFGIGEDISFDSDLIQKFGCNIYGFDPTPKSIDWVTKSKDTKNTNFHFSPYGISDKTGKEIFYLPKNPNYVSGSILNSKNTDEFNVVEVDMKTLNKVTEYLHHEDIVIDVVKMDIEGAEYKVIENILNSNLEIKQICIEFHHRMFDSGATMTKEAIDKLRQHGYKLFAFSDSHEELTFINSKYL